MDFWFNSGNLTLVITVLTALTIEKLVRLYHAYNTNYTKVGQVENCAVESLRQSMKKELFKNWSDKTYPIKLEGCPSRYKLILVSLSVVKCAL